MHLSIICLTWLSWGQLLGDLWCTCLGCLPHGWGAGSTSVLFSDDFREWWSRPLIVGRTASAAQTWSLTVCLA